MQIAIQGKQIDIGDSLREHVETALQEKIGKYFSDAVDATVIISKEAYLYCSEIIVHPGKHGASVQAKASAGEPYPSFDEAADRVAKQLRRYKTRLKDHHSQTHAEVAEAQMARKTIFDSSYTASNDSVASESVVVAEMETPIMTLTVSEAVMNLELGDIPALLFKNKANGGLNMLYRRPDGNIGWVDPASSLK